MKSLDVGCGTNKSPGSVGLDIEKLPGVDVVHNLDQYPYPFSQNEFDHIKMRHVVEHINDVVALMTEVHRIGKPGATVEITTPHYTSLAAYQDPTHRHQFSLLTFEFFCGGTEHAHMAKSRYQLVSRKVEFWSLHDRFRWFVPHQLIGMRWMAERHPIFYERFLAFLFPIMQFTVVLRVEK